ncbi:DUF2125 domain-containing protein [Allorhizobium sp. BGMRC 0089]|uniref:DUF2125 domain-containing protein n=1 Tax=Allorhizobium sonneratiae TaxID=2934936 RepID=UPI00203461AE|nr:DUF2125 domain-containing protein [Allorhizobium sonneratiae]MCM2293484.1 DUF2125 domain-containing protein [Allorhizobium sonneratiae]
MGMAERVDGSSKGVRKGKTVLLGLLAILVFVVIYCVAWLAAAHYATLKLEKAFNGKNPVSASLTCSKMHMSGFPLHIGLNCAKVTFANKTNGLSGSFGAFRSAAEIFHPGMVRLNINSPAIIQTGGGASMSFDWGSLYSSMTTGIGGIDSQELTIDRLRSTVAHALTGKIMQINAARIHTSLEREGDDLAASGQVQNMDFGATENMPPLPPLSIDLDVKLLGQAGILDIDNPKPIELHGLTGTVNGLQLNAGEGRSITASGPLSIDENGLVSGTLKLSVNKLDGWRDLAMGAYPDEQRTIKTVAKVIKALFLGQNQGQVTLQITRGVVVLGFIPIGNIPPV